MKGGKLGKTEGIWIIPRGLTLDNGNLRSEKNSREEEIIKEMA